MRFFKMCIRDRVWRTKGKDAGGRRVFDTYLGNIVCLENEFGFMMDSINGVFVYIMGFFGRTCFVWHILTDFHTNF